MSNPKPRGGYRAGDQRPRKELEDMALAQRLMLHFPEAKTIDELFSLALRRLAATTDD